MEIYQNILPHWKHLDYYWLMQFVIVQVQNKIRADNSNIGKSVKKNLILFRKKFVFKTIKNISNILEEMHFLVIIQYMNN